MKNEGSLTSKIRIVYEGCAKTHPKNKSLNECLLKGKNMVGNLCAILMRFRMKRIGIVADIKKAYLQVQLKPIDRDVTRFLWLKDINRPYSKDNVQTFRFCRVIWGIICSAFILAKVIVTHLSKYNNGVSKDIMNSIYVDNLITYVSTSDEGVTYYEETKRIFNEASMDMCQWVSNDENVVKQFHDDDKRTDKIVKVLGMN